MSVSFRAYSWGIEQITSEPYSERNFHFVYITGQLAIGGTSLDKVSSYYATHREADDGTWRLHDAVSSARDDITLSC